MRLKLKEAERSERIPIQSIVDVNQALSVILRHSYKGLIGKDYRSRAPELKIYAAKFQSGSYLSEILVELTKQVDDSQLAFAFAQINSADIFKVAKGAMEFWKTMHELLAKRFAPNIKVIAEPGSVVFLHSGNGDITVSESIINAAARIPKAGELLTKPLRRGELDVIEVAIPNSDPLRIGQKDADCFSTPVDVDTSIKEAVGDLVEFDKRKRTGTFEYIENHEQVRRTFMLPQNAGILSAIESMKGRCKMFFREEYIDLPGDQRIVVRLRTVKSRTHKERSSQKVISFGPRQLWIEFGLRLARKSANSKGSHERIGKPKSRSRLLIRFLNH